MKKIRLLLVTLVSILLIGVLTLAAYASDEGLFYIDGVNSTAETEKICCQNAPNGDTYLFVPSTADKNALRVFFGDENEITINGNAVIAGEATDAFAQGGKFVVCAGNKTLNVNVVFTTQAAVIVSTQSGSMASVNANKEHKEPGTVIIADSSKTQYSGNLTHIKGRGNATWAAPKKPYNIKLEKKTNLFSMGKSKSWCLLANYYDSSNIRNTIAYNMADASGLDYSSKQIPVCFFANGQFLGLYSLCEKVEIGDNRIEITDLAALNEEANGDNDIESMPRGGDVKSTKANTSKWIEIPVDPENITGGYLLEIDLADRYNAELCGFVTKRGIPVVIKEPEYASKAEVKYISEYFQDFEDAVYSPTGINDKGKHYSDYCDFDSLVKTYLVNDFCVNLDAGITSCYFYKNSDEKMNAGPIWDFDNSLCANHIRNGHDLRNPETTFVREGVMFNNTDCDTVYNALYDHADFEQAVLETWDSSFKTVVANVKAAAEVQADLIRNDAKSDYIIWSKSNASSADSVYEENINKVFSFMTNREIFLDSYYRADNTATPNDSGNKDDSKLSFFEKIANFFKKIFEFFKNLFK